MRGSSEEVFQLPTEGKEGGAVGWKLLENVRQLWETEVIRPWITSIINESLLFCPLSSANHNTTWKGMYPTAPWRAPQKVVLNKGKQMYYITANNCSRELKFSLFQYVGVVCTGKEEIKLRFCL